MNHLGARRRYLCLAILVLAAAVFAGVEVNAETDVTTYNYNRDGALTAVTIRVNGQSPTTRYVTWDNFLPDVQAPATGTVSAGDGRMVGFGPGPREPTARFRFDARDRLKEYSGDAGDETYAYNAGGMLRSSSMGDDGRYFYHDAGANPGVANIYQSGSDLWSAYLGTHRFLTDGGVQVLLNPRKDIAASYDPESRAMKSYVFDAFGSRTDGEAPAGGYDLHDNPFGYAGEYRDPVWGGIYLRARWYHPDLPVFLSRDPRPHLNRYAYCGGNPVMNVDPSGYSFDGAMSSFGHGFIGAMRSADKALNRGVVGHFARIFLAPLMGTLQVLAYPKQFWESFTTLKSGTAIFLALGVASEGIGGYLDLSYAGFGSRLRDRFCRRMFWDIAIGTAASMTTAIRQRGSSQFNYNAFLHGMEYTAGAIAFRGFTGFNVRQGFRLTADDVVDFVDTLKEAPDDTALIFRRKTPGKAFGREFSINKPFFEGAHMGFCHESLIAVTKDNFYLTEVDEGALFQRGKPYHGIETVRGRLQAMKGKYEFVGVVKKFHSSWKGEEMFFGNPLDLDIRRLRNRYGAGDNQVLVRVDGPPSLVSPMFRNKSQLHAMEILRAMRLR